MITAPRGAHGTLDGDALVYTWPDDDLVVRYVERLRPVTTIEALWGTQVPASVPAAALITDEGEYAWLVEGERDDDHGHLTRFLGAVVGDDFLAVVEATTTRAGRSEELGALVEELLVGDQHMLGVRRRAFLHAAPAGWAADHRAPFYSFYRSTDATLYVPPALPRSMLDVADVLASFALEVTETTPVHGTVSGMLYTDGVRSTVLLEDDTYVYPLLAEASAEATLLEVARSVQPIPRRRRSVAAPALWVVD